MRLTVIVTNYNYGRFLSEALGSALAQSFHDTQVIVVDDGSTDNSGAVLDDFTDRVVVVRQPNRGQAAAFNAGMRRCTGDVVIFLDADDRLAPAVGEQAVRRFLASPGLVRVQYPLRLIDAEGLPLGGTLPADPARLARGELRAQLSRYPDDVVWQPTSGNAFARTALDRVLPVPEEPYRTCADYYFSNLVPWLGTVEVLPDVGGDYRLHGANSEAGQERSLDHLRANLVRTLETHQETRRLTLELGVSALPEDPLAVPSLTFTANRLLSLRWDPDGHPFPEDRVLPLLRRCGRAAVGRDDLSWPSRAVRLAWCVLVACLPQRAVPRLAVLTFRAPLDSAARRARRRGRQQAGAGGRGRVPDLDQDAGIQRGADEPRP
jgi:hypothetical protein